MSTFRCPDCKAKLKVSRELAGKTVRCPNCNSQFTLPSEQLKVTVRPLTENVEDVEAELARPPLEIDHEELIDMTAMVDIVFFLLIFFLVTSMSAIQSSAPMPRPEASSEEEKGGAAQHLQDPQKDNNLTTVKINRDDSIEIDGVPYRDTTDLVVRLRQLRVAGGSDASLMVVGHGDATHGAAVTVLDSAYDVGFDHVRLAVLGESGE